MPALLLFCAIFNISNTNNCLISSIGAFYDTLGNIQPQNRSHMNAIQLLGLVHNKHIKKYGIEPILEAFLTDLDLLERVTLLFLFDGTV